MSVTTPLLVIITLEPSERKVLTPALKFYALHPDVSYLHIGHEFTRADDTTGVVDSIDQVRQSGAYQLIAEPEQIPDLIGCLLQSSRPILIFFITESSFAQVRRQMIASGHTDIGSFRDRQRIEHGIEVFVLSASEEKLTAQVVYDQLLAAERLCMSYYDGSADGDTRFPNPDTDRSKRLPIYTNYSIFASIYDRYMIHVNYDGWVKSVLQWYDQYTKVPLARIYETACGTANFSNRLVAMGFDVEASDVSPYMLMVAEDKPFKPVLSRKDMLDPLPQDAYSLVLCMFDSINYLTKEQEITRLLKNVNAALKPKGLFIFDISTVRNSIDNFNDLVNISDTETDYLIHQSQYNEHTNKQLTRLTLFRKTGESYLRYDERHIQRVYSNLEICDIIDKSPLKLVAIHSLSISQNLLRKRNTSLDQQYPRLFYILKRS